MSKLYILICIPAYGSMMKMPCVWSLLALQGWLLRNKIEHELCYADRCGIDVVRNIYGSRLLAEKQFSHALFIDHDMVYKTSAIEKAIACGKPFVAAAATTRNLDLALALKNSKTMSDERAILSASTVNIKPLAEDGRMVSINGLVQVRSVGMGIALLAREVFEKLATTGSLGIQTIHDFKKMSGLDAPLYDFFSPIRDNPEAEEEDYAFCYRWRTLCNGEVWAIIDQPIGHLGDFVYGADLSAMFKPLSG